VVKKINITFQKVGDSYVTFNNLTTLYLHRLLIWVRLEF